jgi:hypothetical protein
MNDKIRKVLRKYRFYPDTQCSNIDTYWSNGRYTLSINTMKLVVQTHYIAEIAIFKHNICLRINSVKSIEDLDILLSNLTVNKCV